MRLFVVAAVLGLATPVFSYPTSYTLSHSEFYDNAQESLRNVTCSDGEYGLKTAGYTTFGSLPSFPMIEGAPQVSSRNPRFCGSCWQLTYTDAKGVPAYLNITAIDVSEGDFIISLEGMDNLTNGRAKSLGSVDISAVRVPESSCGL